MKLRPTTTLLGLTLALAALPRIAGSEDYGIFEWLHNAPGGFYHPDQVFEKRNGLFGVYAKAFIPKDTVLVVVPWSHVILGDDPEEDGPLCCGLVRRLKREMVLGNRSRFFPYMHYVKETQWNISLPSNWSSQGQELLQAILGRDPRGSGNILPPDDPFKWYQEEWIPKCIENSWDDELGVKLSFVIITRSDDHIVIPGTLCRIVIPRISWIGCWLVAISKNHVHSFTHQHLLLSLRLVSTTLTSLCRL
jgi:hypothetical protein